MIGWATARHTHEELHTPLALGAVVFHFVAAVRSLLELADLPHTIAVLLRFVGLAGTA
jgi:hypothetical protein